MRTLLPPGGLPSLDAPMGLDPEFDYWIDLNPNRSIWEAKNAVDPDTTSKVLQSVHQALWSKRLPGGRLMELQPARGCQLQWDQFRLSSDCIGNDYSSNLRMEPLRRNAPGPAKILFRYGSRIGSYVMFPAYRVDRKMTINGARGINTRIADRIDLTLEAIRRHYGGDESPLSDVLARYSDFFELFETFRGYIEFWLLQDLVRSGNRVVQLLPFDDFQRTGYPADVHEYVHLSNMLVHILQARNHRIANAPEAKAVHGPVLVRGVRQSRLPS